MSVLALAAAMLVSLGWLLAGWVIGIDHGLSDTGDELAGPTLLVTYVPVIGSALLLGGVVNHLRNHTIAARRGMACAVVCAAIWLVALVVVLV